MSKGRLLEKLQLSEKATELYFHKALIAHNEGNDKYCLALLKNIEPLYLPQHHHLKTVSAYNVWLEHRNAFNESEIIADALSTFSDYLRMVPFDLIPAYEYVKLSQLYIRKGTLDGALSIMSLASSRGHNTNTIIVLQSWTIMTRVGSAKEAQAYMNYLSSAIMLEPRDHVKHKEFVLSSCDFKLKYIYLFCALRQLCGAKTVKNYESRAEYIKVFNSLLTEAYIFYFGEFKTAAIAIEWFNSAKVWWDMAVDLIESAFILLAEDALWECYLRSNNENMHLQKILQCHEFTMRAQSSQALLEKAYVKNHWNLYIRGWLTERDPKWVHLFMTQEFLLSKIQGCIRSWILRRRFHIIREDCIARLKLFQAKMDNARDKYTEIQYHRLHEMLILWKANAKFNVMLKFKAAQHIQRHARRRIAIDRYILMKKRVFAANTNYVIAVDLLYDLRRSLIIQSWHKLLIHIRRTRASDILTAMIVINGNSKAFIEAIEILKKILRRKRFFSNRKFFSIWRVRYFKQIKLSARVSIRFQVRNLFRLAMEQKKERELEAATARMRKLQKQSAFVPSPLQVFKKFFPIWCAKYREHKSLRLTQKVLSNFCKNMRKLNARRKDNMLVRRRRVTREAYIALVNKIFFRNLFQRWRRWLVNTKILVLQRAVRVWSATICLNRRRNIMLAIEDKLACRRYISLKFTFFKLKKFLFLQRREQHRCSRRLTHAFRMWNFKKRIRCNLLRKMSALNFSTVLARIMKLFSFRVIKWRVFYFHTVNTFDALFKLLLMKNLRIGFLKIHHTASAQKKLQLLLRGMERITILDRLNNRFWSDAHQAVHMSNVLSTKVGDGLYSWEKYAAASEVRLTIETLQVSKSFRIMIALFRSQARLLRNSNRLCSIINFEQQILRCLYVRTDKRIAIAAYIRGFLVRKRIAVMMKRSRRMNEIVLKLICRKNRAVFQNIFLFCKHRSHVASRIQQYCRLLIAKIKVRRKRQSNANSIFYETFVKKCETHRVLVKFFKKMQCRFCVVIGEADKGSKKYYYFSPDKLLSRSLTSLSHSNDIESLQLNVSQKGLRLKSSRSIPNFQSAVESKSLDFQSVDFYNHLFMIRKSGIFTFDCRLQPMSDNEIIYCVSGSDVVFCPFILDTYAAKILEHFKGRKVILCGGQLSFFGMERLLKFIAASIIPEGISIHFSTINIDFREVYHLIVLLKLNYLQSLRELSIDVKCFGVLGVASLLAALSGNKTLEVLFIDLCGEPKIVQILAPLFSTLVSNSKLQEFHILGAVLDRSSIDGLCYSCRNGLSSLRHLKLAYAKDAHHESEALVEICKNRTRIGNGISVVFEVE